MFSVMLGATKTSRLFISNTLCFFREISSLFEVLKKSLPNFQCNVKFVQVKPYSSCFGLPDIKPLYDFIQSFIFTIMDECLTLRLDQAQQCRKQCGSTTSLLTVQQVVTECKEVRTCGSYFFSQGLD